MDFTSDGTAIALGTGSGKIIVKGWRSAEEDDQMIALDDNGGEERVVALAIQRRIKQTRHPVEPNTTSLTASKLSHPLVELKNTTLSTRHSGSRSPVEFGSQTSKINSTRIASPTLSAALRTGESDGTPDMPFKCPPEVNVHIKELSKPTHLRMSSIENDATSVLRSQANSRPIIQTRTTLSNITLATKPRYRIEPINSRIVGKADSKSSSPDLQQQIKEPSDSLKTHDVHQSTSVAGSGDNQVVSSEPDKSKNNASRSTQAWGISTTEKKEKQVGWMVAETGTRSKQPNALTESLSDAEVSGEEPTLDIQPESCQAGLSKTSMHTLLMETLNECRSELREDIKGLHLDVLRMGRAWKSELRLLMDQHARDLKALAEENVQLKRDNESLRRRL